MPRFFRVVKHDPPEVVDFESNQAQGKQPRDPDPDLRRRWDAISVLATEELARATRQMYGKRLGDYIAEFELAEEDIRAIEESDDFPGHFELWADAEHCFRGVLRVTSAT